MAYAALVSLAQLLQNRTCSDYFFNIPPKTVQSLEAQIRDAAYLAEDVIESYISDRTRSDNEYSGVEMDIRKWMSTVQKIEQRIIQNRYEVDLLKAVEQIDYIVEKVMNIQKSCRVEEMPTSGLASSSSAPIGRNKMLGFDDDLIAIKARLCGESSRLQIIPIVGMGGIGKTTLARNIFDDSLVAYHFHVRAWITISQKYHLREILIGLLDSLHLDTKDSSSKRNEVLMEDVYKTLKGRTYLIVMDDLWITEAWDDLRRFFPDDNNGSRIIITTRLTHVAEYVSCSPIHQMHFLSEDQSWNLLRDEVFANQLCPPKLEKIGRIIARKCGLLPLAITVVAGILKKVELTQYRWRQVAENIGLSMANADKHLSKVLSLSYDHLPHHLKACFLYMGGFPEDHEIPVSKLIKLWVAEGFLKPLESKSLEEVAEDYLEDLVRRNLVLVKKKSSNGKFKLCGVHDLLRDLCIHKAQEENFLHVFDMNSYYLGKSTPKWRRLTNHAGFYMGNVIEHACTSTICSVLYFDCRGYGFIFGLLHLKMLRVLHILEVEFRSFPVEITELFHLRYLAFTYHHNTRHKFMVPPSISKLQNLQTLIMLSFSHPYLTPSLPFEIWRIPKLRHVVLAGGNFYIPLPWRNGEHFPVLEDLQTLSGVQNLKMTGETLSMIPNLKKLKVFYTDVKLHLNNLVRLHQLETLSLQFTEEEISPFSGKRRRVPPIKSSQNKFFTEEDIASFSCKWGVPPIKSSSYSLPPSLKKLTLNGCKPPMEDMSIIGLLPNLQVLKLINFDFEEEHWESNEGEFPRLKFLLMKWSNLGRWEVQSTHFPCLEHLIIESCWELEIPLAIGDIATLELIEVDRYSISAANSAASILEEQRSLGNDILQLRVTSPF